MTHEADAKPFGERTFGEALIASVEEALAFKRGEAPARTRVAEHSDPPSRPLSPPRYDAARVRALRERLAVSQEAFAAALNVSVGTVRAWEGGRRAPRGPSLRLLEIAERHPETFLADVPRTA